MAIRGSMPKATAVFALLYPPCLWWLRGLDDEDAGQLRAMAARWRARRSAA